MLVLLQFVVVVVTVVVMVSYVMVVVRVSCINVVGARIQLL